MKSSSNLTDRLNTCTNHQPTRRPACSPFQALSSAREVSTRPASSRTTPMRRFSMCRSAFSGASRASSHRCASTVSMSRSSESAAAPPASTSMLKSSRRSPIQSRRRRHRLRRAKMMWRRRTTMMLTTIFTDKPPSSCPRHAALRLLSRQRFVIIQPFPFRSSCRAHHQQCLHHLPFFQRHRP